MTYVCIFGYWGEGRNIILVTDDIGKAVRDCLKCGYEDEDFETITIEVWDKNELLVNYGPVQSLIREDCPDPQEVITELQEYIDLAIEKRVWQNSGEQMKL